MQFEGRRRSSHMPNLTPLIDIVFLLLVFFMLTSHFVRYEAMNIDLPVAESGKASNEKAQLEVVINAKGYLLYQSHIISLESLLPTLQQALKDRDKKVVRIRGDQGVSLGLTVGVLDVSRKAGATGVDIVTERK